LGSPFKGISLARNKHISHTFMDNSKRKRLSADNGFNSIYGMAFLGALVYFIQHASSFWEGVLGVFKAIFWPGFILYKVLELLNL